MQPTPRKANCGVGECVTLAKYECPRCAVCYCSVTCYRKHSTRCVRAFAADGQEHLRGVTVSDLDRRQSNQTLRNLIHELDVPAEIEKEDDDVDDLVDATQDTSLDDDSSESSVEETADVLEQLASDLDNGKVSLEQALARLPRDLAEEFGEMLRDGRIARFLPLWRPWWISDEPSELPSLSVDSVSSKMARSRASPLITHSVTAVLCAYCHVLRLHNGDWTADPAAFMRVLWTHCGPLSSDERYESIDEAISAFMERCESKGAALSAIRDAAAVCGGGIDWTRRAFGDLSTALVAANSRQTARRKVAFLSAWNSGGTDVEFVTKARALEAFVSRNDQEIIVARANAATKNEIRYKE